MIDPHIIQNQDGDMPQQLAISFSASQSDHNCRELPGDRGCPYRLWWWPPPGFPGCPQAADEAVDLKRAGKLQTPGTQKRSTWENRKPINSWRKFYFFVVFVLVCFNFAVRLLWCSFASVMLSVRSVRKVKVWAAVWLNSCGASVAKATPSADWRTAGPRGESSIPWDTDLSFSH